MSKYRKLCALCFMSFLFLFPFSPDFLFPASALAFGPHGKLECADCHAIHAAKKSTRLAAVLQKKQKKPSGTAAGYLFTGVGPSCMKCHKTGAKTKMGIGRICAIHYSHRLIKAADSHRGIKVAGAIAPFSLLQKGPVECGNCHDPHRTNPNYGYLVIKTDRGRMLGALCKRCHGPNSKRLLKNVRENKKERKDLTGADRSQS